MKSYVISVSLCTGCYRHIQIASSATLYRLHQAILQAFDFEDDHLHAFFMDNRYWSNDAAFFSEKMYGDENLTKKIRLNRLGLSKGTPFKYVFDFGDEWRFQCKLLREIEENTDIPGVIRSVGPSPEQYPEPDWDDEWDEDDLDDDEDDDEDGDSDLFLPADIIRSLLSKLPLSSKVIDCVHLYFEAAARLYGIIPVNKLLEIYNSQNEPIDPDVFCMAAEIIRHEADSLFSIVGKEELDPFARPSAPMDREIIDDALLDTDPADYRNLLRGQGKKPYKILPKEEFLRYADRDYFPSTPQSTAMKYYLLRRGDLRWPIDIWLGIQTMIEIDFSLNHILTCLEKEGITFDRKHDIAEFARLYQELNNHTRKQINRGHTPSELSSNTSREKLLVETMSSMGQLSMLDLMMSANPTPAKQPSKNGPCPCGSGKKYKRCCGKTKT